MGGVSFFPCFVCFFGFVFLLFLFGWLVLFVCLKLGFLCSLSYLITHSVNEDGLELTDLSTSASEVLELKAYAPHLVKGVSEIISLILP